MRHKIAGAKSSAGVLDAKIGAGRLQDIELFAQAGALLAGRAARDIADGITAAVEAAVIDAAQGTVLTQCYAQCWALQCAARLLSATPLEAATLGQVSAAYLARTLGCDTLAAVETQMAQCYARAAAIIDAGLAPFEQET
jgi:glutamate-ammonia-ligase adenylyltransferase